MKGQAIREGSQNHGIPKLLSSWTTRKANGEHITLLRDPCRPKERSKSIRNPLPRVQEFVPGSDETERLATDPRSRRSRRIRLVSGSLRSI